MQQNLHTPHKTDKCVQKENIDNTLTCGCFGHRHGTWFGMYVLRPAPGWLSRYTVVSSAGEPKRALSLAMLKVPLNCPNSRCAHTRWSANFWCCHALRRRASMPSNFKGDPPLWTLCFFSNVSTTSCLYSSEMRRLEWPRSKTASFFKGLSLKPQSSIPCSMPVAMT